MIVILSSLKFWLFIGTVGMFACIATRRNQYTISIWQCFAFTLLLTVTGVAGAKILFALENGMRSWEGVSFFGAVFLIPIIMPLIGFLFRLKPGQTLDICAPCVAIMIACLRVNCFLNGCCGGWMMQIGSIQFLWPTQILDSLGDVIILTWLFQLEETGNSKSILYPIFMICYSSMRFFLEILRDTAKDWFGLSHGQWFSMVAIAIAFFWILLSRAKPQKSNAT